MIALSTALACSGRMPFLPLCLFLATAVSGFAAAAEQYLNKPAEWSRSEEAKTIQTNLLSWQTGNGDWPKNTDTVTQPRPSDAPQTKGTFDNGATTTELRLLARLYGGTKSEAAKHAFLKGLGLILKAQYPNGGWPQSYPPGEGYARHITFNDDTFVRLTELCHDVAGSTQFAFVPDNLRKQAQRAYERAIDCILKTQIKVDGQLTVWCAQHDEVTLEPRPARTYELVSLSGAESARLLQFLMNIDQPSAEIRTSIEEGVRWFEKTKLSGLRQLRENGERKMVRDENAPPLWARFYEIGANRPMFSGRDGVKKYSIEEIEAERRNGYAWYGEWGSAVAQRYARWSASHKS
jgi:PelA/Pel-15E family pectate lyase